MKKKIGYKVIRVNKYDLFISSSAYFGFDRKTSTDQILIYKIGKTRRPLKGNDPICIFESLYFATCYFNERRRDSFGVYKILEVEYIPSEEQAVWIQRIYGQWKHTVLLQDIQRAYKGTVLAKSVKPLREVAPWTC